MQKKIDNALYILNAAQRQAKGEVMELAYSGGKDSDVILELAKMAGVGIRPIYKCTTIDPPGTIAHCIKNNVEIIRPKYDFYTLIQKKGLPHRMRRFCCEILKEYKILDNAIIGIRRAESVKRATKYKEPMICRTYIRGHKHVFQTFPILEWTNEDVRIFIESRHIECHPLYYDGCSQFHVERRLGCMGCPLQADNGLGNFRNNPKLVKAWLRPTFYWYYNVASERVKTKFGSPYECFVRNVFYNRYQDFKEAVSGMFGTIDCKKFLEDYFKIDLTFDIDTIYPNKKTQ